MRRKRDTFKLGITVITMFLLLVGSLWFIGGGGLFRRVRHTGLKAVENRRHIGELVIKTGKR